MDNGIPSIMFSIDSRVEVDSGKAFQICVCSEIRRASSAGVLYPACGQYTDAKLFKRFRPMPELRLYVCHSTDHWPDLRRVNRGYSPPKRPQSSSWQNQGDSIELRSRAISHPIGLHGFLCLYRYNEMSRVPDKELNEEGDAGKLSESTDSVWD